MTRLFEIAAGIAPLLDGSWRYNRMEEERHERCDWLSKAVLNDSAHPGRQIVVSPIWNKPERIEIRGRIPHGYPYGCSRNTITIAQHRDILSIAADINRRFLPGFVEGAETAAASHAHEQERLETYRHQVDILRRFLPGFRHPHSRTLTGSDEFYFKGGSIRMSAYGHDADVKLSLPFDDVVRLLMFAYGGGADQ